MAHGMWIKTREELESLEYEAKRLGAYNTLNAIAREKTRRIEEKRSAAA